MNVALKLAAATEAATGLMLVAYPPLVARLLFGAGVTGLAAVSYTHLAVYKRQPVFSWSETRLQAAWVGGGALGIALPLIARLGFGAVTAMLVGVLVAGIVIRTRSKD